LEQKRVEIDTEMFDALNRLTLFISIDEAKLLRKIRVLMSKSLYSELSLNRHFWETYDKSPGVYTGQAREIFDRYYRIYLCVREKYSKEQECDLKSLLARHHIDENYYPNLADDISEIAMKEFFLGI